MGILGLRSLGTTQLWDGTASQRKGIPETQELRNSTALRMPTQQKCCSLQGTVSPAELMRNLGASAVLLLRFFSILLLFVSTSYNKKVTPGHKSHKGDLLKGRIEEEEEEEEEKGWTRDGCPLFLVVGSRELGKGQCLYRILRRQSFSGQRFPDWRLVGLQVLSLRSTGIGGFSCSGIGGPLFTPFSLHQAHGLGWEVLPSFHQHLLWNYLFWDIQGSWSFGHCGQLL